MSASLILLLIYTRLVNRRRSQGRDLCLDRDIRLPAHGHGNRPGRKGLTALHIGIPLLFSLIIVLRILFLYDFSPVSAGGSDGFRAVVLSVRSLRYSREAVVRFAACQECTLTDKSNIAVGYVDKQIQVNAGDELLILTEPSVVEPGRAGISSFKKGLLRRGIHYIFYLYEDAFKTVRRKPPGLKARIRKFIELNFAELFSGETVPVLKALYFGNKSYIDKSTLADFKRAGVLHILAASGLHTGIVAGVLFFLLIPLMADRKTILVIICAVLYFYLYITDMPVSLLRAFVMFLIFTIQYILDLERNILNTLFLTALVILVIYPFEVYSAGFQLSFGATLGIILFYKFYEQAFSFLPGKIRGALSATLSAQVFVLPVIFAHTKEINLAGFVSNVPVVFTMSVTLVSSIAANLVSVVSSHAASYIAAVTDSLYQLSVVIIKTLSGINGHFIPGSLAYYLLPGYVLLLLPVIPGIRNKRVKAAGVILSVVFVWWALDHDHPLSEKKIAVGGTGGSQYMLIKRPGRSMLLGELSSIREAEVLSAYINRNNIRDIDLYIPVPDYRNLRAYSYLVRKSVISGCCISEDFRFSGYFEKFCRLLDADKIGLRITDLKVRRIDTGYEPGPDFIKEIFSSPGEFVHEILYVLGAGEDTYGLMREILAGEYEMEFLD